jgi:K+-sensing histidine kinase KdpD
MYFESDSERRNMKKKVMVCVTQQKSCERLIDFGSNIVKNGELYVIHVVKQGWKYFSEMKESDALEYLFDVSKDYGAELTVIKAEDIPETLKDFANDKNIDIVVMGESFEKSRQQNMIKRLKKMINNNDIKFEILER